MGKYYAVLKGREVGIFTSWTTTESLVKGYPGAKYKSFKTLPQAKKYLSGITDIKQKQKQKVPTIYTDGSCIDKVGGYGFVTLGFNTNSDQEFCGPVPYNPATNQIAELYAIYKAIIYCTSKNISKVIIYTDSKYSIGCLSQWCFKWITNGWINSKGQEVKNKALIQLILSSSLDIDITYKHVKAHNGDKYNEMADTLANQGRLMSQN